MMRISVITPCLNSSRYIEKAIESVLEQGYDNWEHIVVDGGSKDGTVGILKKYDHLKWISEPDNGQSNAMNKGFAMSEGDLITYLNADDYYLPGAFERFVEAFKRNPESDFVAGNVKIIYQDGSEDLNDPKIDFESNMCHWERNAFPWNPVGYAYRRKVQEIIGGYNEANHLAMDLEFILEAGRRFNFLKIDSTQGVFRLLEETKTIQSTDSLSFMDKTKFVENFLQYTSPSFRRRWKKGNDAHLKYFLRLDIAETKRHGDYRRLLRLVSELVKINGFLENVKLPLSALRFLFGHG